MNIDSKFGTCIRLRLKFQFKTVRWISLHAGLIASVRKMGCLGLGDDVVFRYKPSSTRPVLASPQTRGLLFKKGDTSRYDPLYLFPLGPICDRYP